MRTIETFHPYLSTAEFGKWLDEADCIDERYRIHKGGRGRIIKPGIQTAGGPRGIGIDIVGADALRNGVNPNHTPEAAAKLAARLLRMRRHPGCAGEGLEQIASVIVDETLRGRLVRRTRQMEPGAEESDVETVAGVYLELLRAGVIHDTDTADRVLREGDNPLVPDDIVNSGHVASDVVVSHKRGARFDTYRAFRDGNPAYHQSQGDMPHLGERLSTITAIRPDHFSLMALVRNAATTLLLPHPSGNNDNFGIHRNEPTIHEA